MGRHREESFKTDEELQKILIHERLVNRLSINEIWQKYPKYSIVTYKRFFPMVISKEETKEISKEIRKRNKRKK